MITQLHQAMSYKSFEYFIQPLADEDPLWSYYLVYINFWGKRPNKTKQIDSHIPNSLLQTYKEI